jgi:hypothetical protein
VVEPKVALNVAVWVLVTGTLVMLKVADVCPLFMVAKAGIETTLLVLPSAITNPLLGAGPFMVTVPVALAPPATNGVLRVNPDRAGGLSVRVAGRFTDPSVAVTVTVVDVATGRVLIVTLAVSEPAGTVTTVGTDTAALLATRVTAVPLAPAGPDSVIVPEVTTPPATVDG